MSDWTRELLGEGLPDGYRAAGEVIGRAEFLDSKGELWEGSEFVARAGTPHTTSAVEARVRRRLIERLTAECDKGAPILDLGCADGTIAHDLLDLGFQELVSTDILHSGVAILDGSLDDAVRDRVLLMVDDMMRLPFGEGSFGTVLAWGILSVTPDFERALKLAWSWVAPGGFMLVAEPLLEQALVYALIRSDLEEFRRTLDEGTRPASWGDRENRYGVRPFGFYAERLPELPRATLIDSGGIGMLPSLILGGIAQETQLADDVKDELSTQLAGESLDELTLWRQGFWLLGKS